MKNGNFLLLSAAVFLGFFPASAESLKIGCLNTNEPFAPVVERLFSSAGYDVEMVVVPAERSYYMITHGELDIEFFRTKISLAEEPRVLRIDVPLARVDYRAYTIDPAAVIRTKDDLRNYLVGYARGNKTLELFLSEFRVFVGVDTASLFQMLEANRIGVVVSNRQTYEYIRARGMLKLPVYPQEPPLLTENAYMALHDTRMELLPELERLLSGWVSSGIWQREVDRLVRGGE